MIKKVLKEAKLVCMVSAILGESITTWVGLG